MISAQAERDPTSQPPPKTIPGKRLSPSTSTFQPDQIEKRNFKNSHLSRIDKWTLKAASQLRRFTNWIYQQEQAPPLIYAAASSGLLQAPHRNLEKFSYTDEKLQIVLTTIGLPSVEKIVKNASLDKEEATDISCYESDGYLYSLNLQLAKSLLESRKSSRLSWNHGAWPSNELLVNPAIIRSLDDTRFSLLCSALNEKVRQICEELTEYKTAVYIRLGLNVAPDERSLVVCTTSDSSEDAKSVAHLIWQKVLRLDLTEIN